MKGTIMRLAGIVAIVAGLAFTNCATAGATRHWKLEYENGKAVWRRNGEGALAGSCSDKYIVEFEGDEPAAVTYVPISNAYKGTLTIYEWTDEGKGRKLFSDDSGKGAIDHGWRQQPEPALIVWKPKVKSKYLIETESTGGTKIGERSLKTN